MKIDREAFFRNKIESALVVTSWLEPLKRELGITGVSQVWCDHPAWYFWIEGTPGVYLLEFSASGQNHIEGVEVLTAAFSMKCYPYPEEPLLSLFSPMERKLVQSKAFDETHTPAFEARDKIPEDLFHVAAMAMSTDREQRFTSFAFEGFDHLSTGNGSDPEAVMARPGAGINMGYPLFDALLCMFAHSEKLLPARARLYRSQSAEPGKEENTGKRDLSSEVNAYHLAVDCTAAEGSPGTGLRSVPELYDTTGMNMMYEKEFSGTHFHPGDVEQKLPLPLNSKWWALAGTSYTCHVASSCGCE